MRKASFEVPEALVERHMSARTESVARGLAYQGIDPRKVGVDWKQYRESTREDSVKAARADILLDEIARREGVDGAGFGDRRRAGTDCGPLRTLARAGSRADDERGRYWRARCTHPRGEDP